MTIEPGEVVFFVHGKASRPGCYRFSIRWLDSVGRHRAQEFDANLGEHVSQARKAGRKFRVVQEGRENVPIKIQGSIPY